MSMSPSIVRAVLGAALILAVSATLAWLTPGTISADMSRRLMGALFGAMVVIYANDIPKAISACSRSGANAAQAQAARRFAGWTMVLGGLGYMLASLLAPAELALPLATGLLATALLISIARCLKKSH